jgi:hypothetical protein
MLTRFGLGGVKGRFDGEIDFGGIGGPAASTKKVAVGVGAATGTFNQQICTGPRQVYSGAATRQGEGASRLLLPSSPPTETGPTAVAKTTVFASTGPKLSTWPKSPDNGSAPSLECATNAPKNPRLEIPSPVFP